jgi:hypothetical protein
MHIMNVSNSSGNQGGDGSYFHRTSSVSRCIRDMVFHKYGEPWSDHREGDWGTQFRFQQGHDIEELPCGGKWYVMDVKSAGAFVHGRIFDEETDKPLSGHAKQVGVYAESNIIDKNYPDLAGIKLRDVCFEGYEFGGGMIAYMAVDKPVKGYGKNRVELPKFHMTQFTVDSLEVETWLDLYDEVDKHVREGTIPAQPDKEDEMVWGGVRCQTRWCQRFSLCQGMVPPHTDKVKEIM